MKKRTKRLCALLLAGSMILGTGMSAFAEENTQETYQEEITDNTQETYQEEATDDTETSDEAAAEGENSDVVTDDVQNDVASEAEADIVSDENAQEAAEQEAEVQTADVSDEVEEQSTLKENSWRYQNGERIVSAESRTTYPNAWKKVNGIFVNNYGEQIPGAIKKGIDISEHNGVIDWATLKKSDVDYVIIRCGYGDDEKDQDDKRWLYNIQQCEKYDIPYGVYIYSYARTTSQALSEANHVLRLLKGHNPTYAVYYDMEDYSTLGLGTAMYGKLASTFCNKVASAGYKVGVYANLDWWNNRLTDPVFDNASWSKWVAQYNYQCNYKYPYDMWQCADNGKVSGISGNVDLNFWMNSSEISYSAHVQNVGWTSVVSDGEVAGTVGSGRRMEAFVVDYKDPTYNSDINIQAYVQNYGWQSWKKGGEVVGTQGEALRIEALRIKLSGSLNSKYDVYYRVHIQSYGWLDWASNGRIAGSQTMAKRIEAIQIKFVPKGGSAPGATIVPYRNKKILASSHVQDYGWLQAVENGGYTGKIGQAKRIEALILGGTDGLASEEIMYKVHVQNDGWQDWRQGGEVAGTSGQAKRLEAICIKLTGTAAQQYDVYYRSHVQDYGWLGWAKNGELSGSEGKAKRMEAIQIILLPKGEAAPGTTSNAFVK